MRLDARTGDTGYAVYDAKRCQSLGNLCVWVDSDTAQWGRHVPDSSWSARETVIEVVQEERISIYPDRRLIIFNEVEDEESSGLEKMQKRRQNL